MILVQDDEQLVTHLEMLLHNEQRAEKQAKNKIDRAVAFTRVRLMEEVVKIAQTHAKQSRMYRGKSLDDMYAESLALVSSQGIEP